VGYSLVADIMGVALFI